MNAERFRVLALEQAGAVEGSHHGHADFRFDGKIFATLAEDETFGVLNLTLDDQERFCDEHPGEFEPLKGGWGMRGWTRVIFAQAKAAPVRRALAGAKRKIAGGKNKASRSKPEAAGATPERSASSKSAGPVAKRQTQRT